MPYAACGLEHSLCLDAEGYVWCFGSNRNGQLGIEDRRNAKIPQRIAVLHGIVSVACGRFFSLCIDSNSTVWSFGRNDIGQLGLGNVSAPQTQPQAITGLPPILSVACGAQHSLCLAEDSTIWSFGVNRNGELGLGHNKNQSQPQQVNVNFSDASSISCGDSHSIIIKQNGKVYGCGSNTMQQLGFVPDQIPNSNLFVEVLNASNIIVASCGSHFTALLDSRGIVYSMGANNHEQLGRDKTQIFGGLLAVEKLIDISNIACGCTHMICVNEKGDFYGVGSNRQGKLGLAADVLQTKNPTRLPFSLVCEVSSGGSHVILKDKTGIHVAGRNFNGQLGVNHCNSVWGFQLLPSNLHHIIASNPNHPAKSARK